MAQLRPLPEELQRIAIAELNEVPERLPADIEALRVWIGQQPHLRARTDDQFLVAFLRGCKFSLERAKSKIDSYYSLKTKYPEFFALPSVDDPKIMELLKLGIVLLLPTPLNDYGPRIFFVRLGVYAADKYSFPEIARIMNGMQLYDILADDYINVNGGVTVMDMSNTTASHMLQMTPVVAKRSGTYAEEAVPFRQRATHVVNAPRAFEAAYNTVKSFLPKKQVERFSIHGNNLESLYKHIPLKYLPKEYGGENGSIQEIIDQRVQTFLDNRQMFLDEEQYGVDEKLRPGKAVDYDSVFGVDGSFRSLNVD